ncbi:hypothetical protein LTR66_005223 [Elasticomyces elasticus]|nr:hypothetical protein LTR66_005223 [Elasticomyces elasticus]
MSDKNTSTLQSYIDMATGAAQSAIGTLTGSTADKTEGENKRAEGEAKNDLSHASAKIGPFSASSSGAVTKDDPDRTEGSWNQTIGSGKEAIGNLVGAEGLKQEGIRQNQEGKGQEAKGQISDFSKGVTDRVFGTVGGMAAGVTGDRAAQAKYEAQHDAGKTQQKGAEVDIQKQNP